MSRSSEGLAERLLALLVVAYPRTFRRRFGMGLTHALVQEWRRAREAGVRQAIVFWASTLVAIPVRGLAERAGAARRGRHQEDTREAVRSGRLSFPGTGERMADTVREIRLALRRLRRRPAFTVTAVGTLALGIGGATAVFSVVHGVLLSPLPYPEADRLVRLGHQSSSRLGMPDAGYFHYRDESRTLEEVGVYFESSTTIAGTGRPMELGIVQATPSVLSLLGVEPRLGRLLREDDARPGAESVAVVTHQHWVRLMGSDPDPLGRVAYEGSSARVVGVMPEEFEFVRPPATFVFGNPFEQPDVFLPLGMNRSTARFGNFMYQGIGRLGPEATAAEAERELNVLMFDAAETYAANEDRGGYTPEGLRENGHRAEVDTVKDELVGRVADVLWVLMASVGIVLLIATANVANLFLVRAESRQEELAIQRALGGDRRAMTRSTLSETLVVSIIGGLLGAAIGWIATESLLSVAPADLPRQAEVGMHGPVLAFAATLSLGTGLLLGWAPTVLGSRSAPFAVLSSGGRGATVSPGRRRTQNALMVGQVALALVLLIGSGLLLRTFQQLRAVAPGFDARNVLTVDVSLGENIVRGAGFDDGPDDAVRSRFMLDLVETLEAVPGVEQAAFSGELPLDGVAFRDHIAVERHWPEEEIFLRVFVGPGYLEAIGARLLQGRELERGEFAGQVRSVVVNRLFAERWWPGQDPVGQRLTQYWTGVDPDGDVWYTVVGVVDDIHETSLMAPPEPTIYLPTMMLPEGGFGIPITNFVAVLRTATDPLEVAPAVRQAIAARYPELPVNEISTLEQRTARSHQDVSFAMVLLVIAGATSALLGLVGIYGTAAYVVGRRRREFGLRIALGASTWQVERGILGSAAAIGALGVAMGLLVAVLASGLLETLLFGIQPTDPSVYAGAGAGLLLLVVLASLLPAARAAAADPMEALRAE